ncbi:hypothetical protein AQUCO_00600277v1 [Aquilegia coerulea]|uniref:Uncharacterized protein n=1 Tax=Aquilegia coerulea TaxID=218851 RepID=A0A2G5ENU0_AQUCA|nr:hypothetical protein AQUCO_00600277v1 [Aquilegia coerulea]
MQLQTFSLNAYTQIGKPSTSLSRLRLPFDKETPSESLCYSVTQSCKIAEVRTCIMFKVTFPNYNPPKMT